MILGVLCLPIAIVGVIGTVIDGISASGMPIVGAFVVVCIASLAWALWLFRNRRDIDPGIRAIRLHSAESAAPSRSASLDDPATTEQSQSWPTVRSDRWVEDAVESEDK
jgi:hypothetical protein